jgi:hypothetical protein
MDFGWWMGFHRAAWLGRHRAAFYLEKPVREARHQEKVIRPPFELTIQV